MFYTAIFSTVLAFLGLSLSVGAFQANESLVPRSATKLLYCSKFYARIANHPGFKGGKSPFRLAVYNATWDGARSSLTDGNFTRISDTAIYVKPLPDLVWVSVDEYVEYSWVVDVPYGNYVLLAVIDSNGRFADNDTLGGVWVAGGGGGKCNQTEFTFPYDAASMAIAAPPGREPSGSLPTLSPVALALVALTSLAGLGLLL